jgi:hypothetical protein
MGMFDYVDCKYPLPDAPPVQGDRFQTKDFEDRLLLYIITEDGRLLVETFDYYDVVERDKDPLGFGGLQRAGERTEEVPFHGDFNFYTLAGNPSKPEDYDHPDFWYEYCARFTEGRLTWIKRVTP